MFDDQLSGSEPFGTSEQTSDSLAKLTDVLNQLRDAIVVYDLDGSVAGCNARLLEMYEIVREEVRLFDVREGSAGSAHPIAPLPRLWPELLGGTQRTFECRPRTARDGSLLYVECFARRARIASDEKILVDIHDIRSKRRSEEVLRESKAQLESAILVRTRELQEKIRLIQEQQETLLALSTPVIKVWEGILVLPLIGTIDSKRSQQITESLLSSIVSNSSRAVIIDITGVELLDEQVLTYLMRTVQAARLLGASCSVAGMSPSVARSLATLGVELSALRTHRNLQSGLQETISRLFEGAH
jgi:rsbT co-antagonist protein RsbR